MTHAKASLLVKHTAIFTYLGSNIPFNFWTNTTVGNPPDTVLFLGTGQIGKIPGWIARAAPTGLVVVDGMPHWHSDPTADDLVSFANNYMQCAFEAVLNTFDRAAMHVIGESQAAPSVIWLANQLPDKVTNIALVLPMGLNTSSFGATDEARFAELRRRALKSILQRDQSALWDVRNLYISGVVAKIIIAGLRDGSTVRKYTKGISQDMIKDFKQLLADRPHHRITLLLGGKDHVFPASEITESLKQAAISKVNIEILPEKSHGSLAVRSARPLVSRAMAAVRLA
jgi:pimeloyl-ACP methyl ester carboxylesterase